MKAKALYKFPFQHQDAVLDWLRILGSWWNFCDTES